MHICIICGTTYDQGREMSCSDACHEKLIRHLIDELGKFKKIVRAATGVAYKVPTRDIIEKGVQEQDLDQYPKWED